jgi:hypothetical protein
VKTVYGCLCAFLLGVACYADAHNNPAGATIGLCLALVWFIAYCAADDA